jgi:hypothetical protein
MIVSAIFTVPAPSTNTPLLGRLTMRLRSTVSADAPVMWTPYRPPPPGSETMTRLRSATLRLAAVMLIAGPPTATTLPTAPGTARIVTDFATVRAEVL